MSHKPLQETFRPHEDASVRGREAFRVSHREERVAVVLGPERGFRSRRNVMAEITYPELQPQSLWGCGVTDVALVSKVSTCLLPYKPGSKESCFPSLPPRSIFGRTSVLTTTSL
jgi:hypothetical protein